MTPEVVHRSLHEQPVLRSRGLWNPTDPESGAGAAFRDVNAEVDRQGLTRAGAVYVCLGELTADGLVPGEAVVPVDRLGESTEAIEALTLPATEALSVVYRDDIHLTAGAAVKQHLRQYAQQEGLVLDGEPRWTYYTSPDWDLEPNDHLIELLWPH
ncbi:hypothetical protein [Kribbella sp. NPDC048928]|uniref:hypothetical protein n=1 Tax=Kribbella sp. NPDC048928 TaxID=3364111 RepID=UPI003710F35D